MKFTEDFQIFLHPPRKILHVRPGMILSDDEIRERVRMALAEDIGSGDVTTLATVPAGLESTAAMIAREPMVLAGAALAAAAFCELSPKVTIHGLLPDGTRVAAGARLMRVQGPARALLTAERVALNFVQRLSGVATLTDRYVQAVRGTRARILDTRKTTPGLRKLEKYAVACGGGQNHRFGLHDQILIKDNHLSALAGETPNAVAAAVQRSRRQYPGLAVEVEADTIEQVQQALEAGADIILLDNMAPALLRQAVSLTAGRAKLEASGGIDLATVSAVAQTGVDFISVGALTHSARAMDIGLDFEPAPAPQP